MSASAFVPTFNPQVKPAERRDAMPGAWLCQIVRQRTVKGETRTGIETGLATKNHGDPMWSYGATVIDDHPDAPKGSVVLDNLVWNEKGTPRAYSLLQAMGYDLSKFAPGTQLVPDLFYEHPFVMKLTVNDRGYLEPDGFACFLPHGAKRGPSAAKPASGRGAGGGARASAGSAAVAPAASDNLFGDD